MKKEIDLLRQETFSMEKLLEHLNMENLKVVQPTISSDFQMLINKVNMQNHENTMLQKQITELANEKNKLQSDVWTAFSKIQVLEEQVGMT